MLNTRNEKEKKDIETLKLNFENYNVSIYSNNYKAQFLKNNVLLEKWKEAIKIQKIKILSRLNYGISKVELEEMPRRDISPVKMITRFKSPSRLSNAKLMGGFTRKSMENSSSNF